MSIILANRCWLVALGTAGLAFASPVQAQSFEELDQLVDMSVDQPISV
mgnify:CR=1 FL=1